MQASSGPRRSIDSVSPLARTRPRRSTTSGQERQQSGRAGRPGPVSSPVARYVQPARARERALTRRPATRGRYRKGSIRAPIGAMHAPPGGQGGRGGGRPKLRPGWRRPAGGRGGRCVTLAAPRPGRALYPFMGTRPVFHAFVYIRTEGQRAHHIALLLAGSRRRRRSGTQGLGASAPGFPFRRPVALCLWSTPSVQKRPSVL